MKFIIVPSMQYSRFIMGLLVAGLWSVAPEPSAAAGSVMDDVAVLRASLKLDRTAVVAEAMQLTEEEGKVFWPLYREYRSALDRTHDGLVKIMLEYIDTYPNVSEKKAAQMLKEYTDLDVELAETRETYLKKFAKTITAGRAMRLAQIENRLDLALRVQLAGLIPLAPVPAK